MKASREIVHFAPYYSPFSIAVFVVCSSCDSHPTQCLPDEPDKETKPTRRYHQKKLGFVKTRYST
jgi:hypothetical protein